MNAFTAHVTGRDGIPRRFALLSFDRDDALIEARLLAAALFGAGFTFSVRPA